jgi:TPR repeat protein
VEGKAVKAKLRERLVNSGRDRQIRCQFDLDKRLYLQRLMLAAATAMCSTAAVLLLPLPGVLAAVILLTVPASIALGYRAYKMRQIRQPVIAIGRNGIWDRRLGAGVVPWTEILRIRTDRFGNIVLDPWREFSVTERDAGMRWSQLMRRFDPSLNPGSLRIRLTDIDGEMWDVLAAIDASLPDYLRSLWKPEARTPLFAGDRNRAIAGICVTVAATLLLYVSLGGPNDPRIIVYNLGPATDIGAALGRKDTPIVDLYRHATEQGDLDARMRLGLMFHEGEGVSRDPTQAAHWFRLAASEKLPAGQAALGYLHEQGMGVEQDFSQALIWYRAAAGRNHAWAQYRLGLMYRDGRGVSRDNEKAVDLLKAAAAQGDVGGMFHLAEMYENGWGAAQDAAAAADLYYKAAARDHDRAEYNLAVMYREGRGVPRDAGKAAQWFERSALTGFAPAQYALGLAYEVGSGVAFDPGRSALWYYVAERHGHAEASNRRRHVLETMTPQQRRDADLLLREWMQDSLLKGDLAARFSEYQGKQGAKAFALAMNGAWAQTEAAPHARDAVYRAMKRCREYAPTCILYAVGDTIVAGMREAEVDAVVARQVKKTAQQ